MKVIAQALLLSLALPALACEPGLKGDGVRKVEGKNHVVAWRVQPAPLQVSEFFAVEVTACARSGGVPKELRIDAVMPEHKHGMNYRPTVAALGDGRFRAEGLLLHMPGMWEFSFDLRGSGSDEVVRQRVTLR